MPLSKAHRGLIISGVGLLLLAGAYGVHDLRNRDFPGIYFYGQLDGKRWASSFHPTGERQAYALRNSNPARQARLAWERGDLRLIAIMGYLKLVPGTQMLAPHFNLEESHGTKTIWGTGDNIQSVLHAELNTAAHSYAERYNQALAELCLVDEEIKNARRRVSNRIGREE